MDVARGVVAERGLASATIRAIAAAGEVSTGFVMHHFADKVALTTAVLDRNNAVSAKRVRAAIDAGRGLTGLADAIDALLPLDDARRLQWRVWVAFWVSPQDHLVPLLVTLRSIVDLLAEPLTQAVEDGELPAGCDVTYEAMRVVVLAAGLGLAAGIGPGDIARSLSRRMVEDHLATLTARAEEAR